MSSREGSTGSPRCYRILSAILARNLDLAEEPCGTTGELYTGAVQSDLH